MPKNAYTVLDFVNSKHMLEMSGPGNTIIKLPDFVFEIEIEIRKALGIGDQVDLLNYSREKLPPELYEKMDFLEIEIAEADEINEHFTRMREIASTKPDVLGKHFFI